MSCDIDLSTCTEISASLSIWLVESQILRSLRLEVGNDLLTYQIDGFSNVGTYG